MADIKVRIVAVDEASKPLDDTAKKAKGTADAMKSLSASIGSVAAGMGLQLGLTAIVGAMKDAVVASFELADALEQSKIAFTTMLGSGEAAGKMLDDLKTFADKTPFEFQDIQAAAKRLMAMGTAAEDVIPTLRAVGDAAAGLGGGKATIDGITLALGQMGAKGKISTQELNQLTERGIPAMRYLAEAAGKSTGEMAKLVENGLVPANTGVKVLLESMQRDFGGLMAKQADTASGKLSTMKDSMASLGTAVGRSFIPAVKEGADIIAYFSQSAADAINHVNKKADTLAILVDAYGKGYLAADLFAEAVKSTVNETATTGYKETTYQLEDLERALELVKVAANNQAREMEQSETRFTALYEAVNTSTTALDINTTAIDENKDAIKLHKEILGVVSGASAGYKKAHEDNAEAAKNAQKKIDDLTKAHGKNHAALLAGKGSIVDNADAIERANIQAERGAISFANLQERFANQDNIDNYNERTADLSASQTELNDALAKGEIDQKKFDDASGKLAGRQADLKESLDNSQMSLADYNLAQRDHALDVKDSATKLGELTAQHNTGKTAVQLAAAEQFTYNTKLKEAQAELEKTRLKELELRTYVATAIKENIIDRQIERLLKDGLTAQEIKDIQDTAAAFGIATSDKVKNRLIDETSAQALETIEALVAKNYIDGSVEQSTAHRAMVESIGEDITNGFIPDMEKAKKAAQLALQELLLFEQSYNGLQSKEIVLTIKQVKIFEEQAATFREAGQVYPATVALEADTAAKAAGGYYGVGQGKKGASATGGAIIGNGAWRATGGAMGMGGGYLVGEHGPELFDPAGSGRVFSNNTFKQLGSSQQSGGNLRIGTLNIYGVQTASQLYDAITAEARARGLTFGLN